MSRRRAASLALLLAALLFRLGLAFALANDEPDDGRLYALIAHNVLAHRLYSAGTEPPYGPTYIRVPGYPLFLAATYSLFGDGNNTAVRAIQAVVDTATCWLVSLVAVAWAPHVWLPASRDRLRVSALAIAAACPFPAIYVATILTEPLAMFLGTLAVLLTTRALGRTSYSAPGSGLQAPGRVSAPSSEALGLSREPGKAPEPGARSLEPTTIAWLAAGAAAGATALVRPEFILYAGAAGLTLLVASARDLPWAPGTRAAAWMARVAQSGIALTLGVVLVLAPWTVRNLRAIGAFQPLNPRSLAMPGEFVAYGYADWVRTWIDHPRYVAPALFTVDLAPIRIEAMPASAFESAAERDRVQALLAAYNTPPADADPDEEGRLPPGGMTPAIDAAFAALARERIAAHPLRYYAVLPLKRALTLWFDTHADFYPFAGYLFPVSAWDPETQQQVWLPLFALLVAAWTIAGWAGAHQLYRHRETQIWLLFIVALIVPRLCVLASLENPEPRYTVEFFPIVSALAAIGVEGFRRRLRAAPRANRLHT